MTAPSDQPERPFPVETAVQGPWGGPVYSHRGAEIRGARGGHVRALFMEGHPLHASGSGTPGTVTPLIDLWLLDGGRLPACMRAVPRAD